MSATPLVPASVLDHLLAFTLSEKDLLPLVARAVADHLGALPAGTRVAFYGCGVLAKALVGEHRPLLDRLASQFIITQGDGAETFEGFPKRTVQHLQPGSVDRVVLLSHVHREAMLQNLARFDRSLIFTLQEIIRGPGLQSIYLSTLSICRGRIEPIAARVRRSLGPGRLSGVFLMHSTGHNLLNTLERLRSGGLYVVVVLQGEPDPAQRIDMVAAGIADECLYTDSYEESCISAFLMMQSLEFSFLDLWIFQNNLEFIRDLVTWLPGRVVVNYDDFLQLMLENEGYAKTFAHVNEVSLEHTQETLERIFKGAAGILYKDSPRIIDHLAERYSYHPHSMQTLPVLVPPPATGSQAKYSSIDGRLHVVFAHSLWREARYQTYVTYDSILETIGILTGAGVHFTLFNNLDADGHEYQDLVRYSRNNPLFEYRTRVPFKELLEIMPRYDFGWASYKFSKENRFDNLVRYTLGLKIFTYAGAGLPVLVSRELEYMSTLVQDRGFGLAIDFRDWTRLPEIFRTTDMDRLQRNAQALCREPDGPERVAKLLAFYRIAHSKGRDPI